MKPVIFIAISLMIATFSVQAQENNNVKPFEKISVSANIGMTGFGVQGGFSLNDNLALRVGFSSLLLKYNSSFDEIDTRGRGDFRLQMYNGLALLDFFPMKKSGFHLTGGFYAGNRDIFKASVRASQLVDIGSQVLVPVNGNVTYKINANLIRPYLGIGFGRTIPKRPVGFKLELGALFLGKTNIESNNSVAISSTQIGVAKLKQPLVGNFIYPQLSLQLNFRVR